MTSEATKAEMRQLGDTARRQLARLRRANSAAGKVLQPELQGIESALCGRTPEWGCPISVW